MGSLVFKLNSSPRPELFSSPPVYSLIPGVPNPTGVVRVPSPQIVQPQSVPGVPNPPWSAQPQSVPGAPSPGRPMTSPTATSLLDLTLQQRPCWCVSRRLTGLQLGLGRKLILPLSMRLRLSTLVEGGTKGDLGGTLTEYRLPEWHAALGN